MPVPRVPGMPVPAAPRDAAARVPAPRCRCPQRSGCRCPGSPPHPGCQSPAPPLTCLGAAPAAACAPGAEPRSPAGPAAAAEAPRGRRGVPPAAPPGRRPPVCPQPRGGSGEARPVPGGCDGAGTRPSPRPVPWGVPRALCRGEGWGCSPPGSQHGGPDFNKTGWRVGAAPVQGRWFSWGTSRDGSRTGTLGQV